MLSTILYSTALLSLANAHGVILAAQGEAGSPPSVGFQGTKSRIGVQVGRALTFIQLIPPSRETAQVSVLANKIQPSSGMPKLMQTLSTSVAERS
jgi:hypothetical protein